MNIYVRDRSSVVLAWLLASSVACGSDIELSEDTSSIINGTPVVAENSGWVRLVHANMTACSGTLVNNEWVLTAAHCDNVAGDTLTMGSQSRIAKRVIQHPDVGFGVDVALVQMNSPMSMNGSPAGFRRALVTSLLPVGTTVTCFGYGHNTLSSGQGTLRSAILTIANAADNLYTFHPNSSGQIMWEGDSGGSCLDSAGAALTVHRRGTSNNTQVLSADGLTSNYFAPWVNGVLDGSWYFDPLTTMANAPLAGSDLSSYIHGGIRHAVYRQANNGHVIEMWFSGGVPAAGDLTALLNDVPAAGAPFGYEENGLQHIVFRSSDGHIRELWWQSPSGWHNGDLTAITGATNASGDPVAYLHGGKQNVIYRGSGNHIHALVWTSGPGWSHQNITSAIGAPRTASDPTVYVHNGNEQKIVYRTSGNHIIELWNVGNGWNWSNLTTASNAPLAAGDPSGYSFGGFQHIIYRASGTNHVIELWGGIGGWTAHDVSATTGAPNAAGDPRGYASVAQGKQHIVYRVGNSNAADIVLLTGSVNGNFQLENLTVESGARSQAAPTGTPAAMWHDAVGTQHVYYRDSIGAVFEMRTPRI